MIKSLDDEIYASQTKSYLIINRYLGEQYDKTTVIHATYTSYVKFICNIAVKNKKTF